METGTFGDPGKRYRWRESVDTQGRGWDQNRWDSKAFPTRNALDEAAAEEGGELIRKYCRIGCRDKHCRAKYIRVFLDEGLSRSPQRLNPDFAFEKMKPRMTLMNTNEN